MQAGYTCHRCLKGLKQPIARPGKFVARRRPVTTTQVRFAADVAPPRRTRHPIHSTQTKYETWRKDAARTGPAIAPEIPPQERVLLLPDNLFHSFSNSPAPRIRERAAFMKSHAYCPHPAHRQTRIATSPYDSEARKGNDASALPPAHVRFECPDCGIPTYCSEDHWADDYESHLEICDTLRQANEDDHDLNSGRFFPEFEYPPEQMEEILTNMYSWDTYLYTREYEAMNNERSLRQATRLLTYPMTIGSVIHELSPYNLRNGLTADGLKSFTALRHSLHTPRDGRDSTVKGIKPIPAPVRIFILGARAESSLPREVWLQLDYIFPRTRMHIIFIGPESMINRDHEFPLPERNARNPFGRIVEDRLGGYTKISTYVEYYHTMHKAQYFQPFDPYFDCFVLFHPGLGHPASAHEWEETLPQLLETKVPVICTGYSEWDMARDKEWVFDKMKGEVDMLIEPRENIFRSMRWDLNDLDPGDVSCGNWGLWAFRGKRYEAQAKGGIFTL
ncbi:MAG: hypothetical protein Q9190_001746 [Brigantiaea leucoxantha]